MAGELLGKRMEKSLATWEVLPERRASFWAVRVWTTGHSCRERLSARQLHHVKLRAAYLELVLDLFEAQGRPQRDVVQGGILGALSSDESYGETQDEAQGQPAPIDPW